MAEKVELITEAQLGFALKLLYLQHNDNSSTVFSPVSIATALAMMYLGAEGNTAEEIKNALAGDFSESVIHSHFTTMLKHIKDEYAVKEPPSPPPEEIDSEDEEAYEKRERLYEIQKCTAAAVLETVNRVYVKKDINLEAKFVKKFDELYQGGIDKIDFMETSNVEKINEFIAEATRGKIQNLVTKESFSKATELVLINAIYFKGRWHSEFHPSETENANFYSAPGKIKNVNAFTTLAPNTVTFQAKMMRQGVKRWQFSENDKFQFLSLPYNMSEISLKIILPKERFGLDDVIKSLTPAELSKHLTNEDEKQVIVRIPRFEVKTQFDAVKLLKDMGIKELFEAEANLQKMTTDEEGTEAAAITKCLLSTCCAPPPRPIEFTADHPFLFLITDNKDHIYFCGTVTGSEFGECNTSKSSNKQAKGKASKNPAKKRRKI
uniref:Serpin domain-containing protein n=1 Tax=Panagrolaimus davidi TaxID=227884 RepID=A0A914QN08_9BILA